MKGRPGRVRRAFKWLAGALVIYVAVAVFLTIVQRQMIYFPARHSTRLALSLGEREGVLLFAPYNNFTAVSQHHMPLFPVRWMLHDRFPSDEHLRGYHGPLAVVLAGRDTVVPNRFGRRLHDGYEGPKKLWLLEDAGHNDVMQRPAEWWRDGVRFFTEGQASVGTIQLNRE